nr:hypothetical protein HCOI_01251700 [Haemonchus contortus]
MDDDGNPLLVHNQLLERAIFDRSEILGDQAANLREYGNALELECRQEDSQSRDQLLAAIESIRGLISDFVARSRAVSSPKQQIDDQEEGAGAIRIDAQSMEQLHDSDEEVQIEDDLVSVDEDAQGTDESSTETSLVESDDDNQEDAVARNDFEVGHAIQHESSDDEDNVEERIEEKRINSEED